jgi:putative spermidine/putrescine transport system permease protein
MKAAATHVPTTPHVFTAVFLCAFDRRRMGRWLLKSSAGLCLPYMLMRFFFVTWHSFFREEIPTSRPEGYSLRGMHRLPTISSSLTA